MPIHDGQVSGTIAWHFETEKDVFAQHWGDRGGGFSLELLIAQDGSLWTDPSFLFSAVVFAVLAPFAVRDVVRRRRRSRARDSADGPTE